MAIASITSRNNYTGNGATSSYAYSFYIQDDDHLEVIVKDTSGVETTLTKTTDYTVTGVGSSSGGNVVLVNSSQAWLTSGNLITGYKITIRRKLSLIQDTDLRNEGSFYPETHEDAFDRFVMIDQQQQDEINRSLKAPVTDGSSNLELPNATDRASKFLAFDSNGDPIASDSTVSGVPVTAFAETLLDDASAAEARTTLGIDATSFAASTKYGPGVILNGYLSASVASNNLTLSILTAAGTAPSASDPVIVVFRSSTASSGAYVTRTITSATTTTINSGTTLGHSSGKEETVYVYLLDNSGTVEIALANRADYDHLSLQTTVAFGSDFYSLMSSTARTSKAIVPFARFKSTQTTAGTWAAAPTEITTLGSLETENYPDENYIINGNFDLWQRGTSTTDASSSSFFLADRFAYIRSGAARHTVQRSTDVPTLAQSGFQSMYSLHLDVTTANGSPGSGDHVVVAYPLEGHDFAAIKGKVITVSFWVKATITGTYCVSLVNNGVDRSYATEYTVNVADTWERKSVTIPINYSGGTDNFVDGRGGLLYFVVQCGSTYQTSANTWANGNFFGTSSQVNGTSSLLNNFKMAQVKLQLGRKATGFKRRGHTIGEEVRMAQRFYEKSYALATDPGTATTTGVTQERCSSTNHLVSVWYKATKAKVPDVTLYNPSAANTTGTWRDSGPANKTVATGVNAPGYMSVSVTSSVDTNSIFGHWTADAEILT